MREIIGIKYLTTKEAVKRYGYSQDWFERGRYDGSGPPFFKLKGMGKALYEIESTDKWFKDNLIMGE